MARKPAKTPRSQPLHSTFTTVAQSDDEPVSFEELELEDFLDGLGPDGVAEVSIYRRAASGKQSFVASGPPAQFSESFIQKEFGEGDYIVRAKLNGRWFKSKSFSVEAAPGVKTAAVANPAGTAETFLREQLAMQQTMMLSLLGTIKGPDLGQLLTGIAAMQAAAAPKQTDLAAIVAAIAQLKPPSEDWITKSRDLISLARELGGKESDGDGSTNWAEVAREVVPLLRDPSQPAVANTISDRSTPAVSPAPANAAAPAINPQAVKQGLAWLKQKALMGSDPGLYIDVVVDNAANYASFIHIVRGNDFSFFVNLDPELSSEPYASWFRTLYDGIRSAFSRENSVETHSAGAGGNTGNAGTNGAVGAGRPS